MPPIIAILLALLTKEVTLTSNWQNASRRPVL